MEQVSGPVVAIGLVLSAVFVPCAFITGIIGQFFRQFALTIAVSTVISAFNSLTLSPALSALLLQAARQGALRAAAVVRLPADRAPGSGHKLGIHLAGAGPGGAAPATCRRRCSDALRLWGPIAGRRRLAGDRLVGPGCWAGRSTSCSAGRSACSTAASTSRPALTRGRCRACCASACVVLVIYGGLLVLTWWGFTHTPTGFIPQQDKGYLLVNVQLPDAASVTRTREGGAADREDRPARRRASSTPSPSPASRSCSTPTPPTSARCT